MCKFQPYRCRIVVLFVGVMMATGLMAVLAEAPDPEGEAVALGERLVHNMDCNVCHTPKVFTPQGPRPDTQRLLAGHPEDEPLAAIPEGLIGPTAWGGVFNNHLTAWVGPWGISYASNLTPDSKTGLGRWSEEVFRAAMRQGLHVAEGRPFLPPMPTYDRLTDQELHAIYVYLRSIKAVKNAVPKSQVASRPGGQD